MMMKQLAIRDTQQFREGRELEQEFARQQLLRGGSVVRCYDLNVDNRNKAPILEGPYSGLRLPDLLCCYRGETRWRECKSKASFTYTHTEDNRRDQGIGLRCYRDYLKVEQESGFPVDLIIGERASQIILIQSLKGLGPPRIYDGDKMDPGGMAFWPRASFNIWGRYDTMPGQESLPFGQRSQNPKIHYSPERWR